MNTIDRENAVLSSFLYADDVGTDKTKAFKLDSKIFTNNYRRAVANKINDEMEGNQYMGYLSITLEEQTEGTTFEQDWINILTQTPLPFSVAKRLHDDLEKEYKKRLTKSFR